MNVGEQGQVDWLEPSGASEPGPEFTGGETAALAVGIVQLAQTGAVSIPMPGTLEMVVVPVHPDTVYDLPDGTEGAWAREADGNLLLAFPNGGLVEFLGFSSAASGVQFHTPDNGTLDADSFLNELQWQGDGLPAALDSPNFSTGPSPEILPGLSPTGALAVTELPFVSPAVPSHFPGSRDNDSTAVGGIDDNPPNQPIHLADVLTSDQSPNKLFDLTAEHEARVSPFYDMLYSVADTHSLMVPGVISFHFIGE
jgi:hypothetical protein